MMKRVLLRATIPALLAGACAPPPPAAAPSPASPVLRIAPPPAVGAAGAHAPLDPDSVSVTALLPPAKLAIDGDFAEWGALLPPRDADSAGPEPEQRTSGGREPKGALPSGPNPRDAASHAAIALTNDALLIAAELQGEARDGIWLGLGSPAPELPPIGFFGRGGYVLPPVCEFEQVHIGEGSFENGKPNPPEVVAACRELIARHEKLLVTHAARFSRVFRIDREGARLLHPDGSLSRVEGAKHALKPGPRGATVEVSLPLAAMPRLAAAPLEWLRLVARPAAAPRAPELPLEQWVWVKLPAPVSFEPMGELRARALAMVRGRTFFPPGLSYHPSDPLHVESVSHAGDAMSLKAQEETLYTKARSFGDVEIGHVSAVGRFLAISRGGKLAEVIPLESDLNLDRGGPTELRGMIERDGELHVFWYTPRYYSYDISFVEPAWSVLAIGPDGSVRGDVLDSDAEGVRWEEASDFASAELDTFGIRGTTHFPDGWGGDYQEKLTGKEIVWRWDSKARKYRGKLSNIPVPAKPKRKK